MCLEKGSDQIFFYRGIERQTADPNHFRGKAGSLFERIGMEGESGRKEKSRGKDMEKSLKFGFNILV